MMMRYQARMHPTLDILCDTLGRVFLLKRGRGFKSHWTFGYLQSNGYRRVNIAGKLYKVSRLICETFHGLAPEGKPTCEHIDRNRDSNVPWNLMWADYKQQADNRQVCYDSLAKYGVRGCDNPAAYKRARRASNQEVVEQDRAHCRKYYVKQRALGKRTRKCPDGKRRFLTDKEFFEEYGFWPKRR